MSEYLEEGFEDWLRDLPAEFLAELYGIFVNNSLGGNILSSLDGNDLTYVGPLNSVTPISESIKFVLKPKPITEYDIGKLDSILRDNGVEEKPEENA